MTTAKKDSTKEQDNSTQLNQSNSEIGIEIEQTRRLRVLGLSFEETTVNGVGKIQMSGEGVSTTDLSDEDVSSFVRFFTGFQRRQDRGGSGAVDGRGQVTDASSDSRLKGNEEQRPHDTSGSRRAGSAK